MNRQKEMDKYAKDDLLAGDIDGEVTFERF